MKFKHSLLAMTFMALALLDGRAQKVETWNNPATEYGNVYFDGFFNIAMDVTKVELNSLHGSASSARTILQPRQHANWGRHDFILHRSLCQSVPGNMLTNISGSG